jgi:hypothetical protein
MARPKRTNYEIDKENEIMRALEVFDPKTPQAQYLIELIQIVRILGRSLDEITDEIMIYFGETLQIATITPEKK